MVREAQDAKENAERLAEQKKEITEQIRYDRRHDLLQASS
jgi:hypothetical protein